MRDESMQFAGPTMGAVALEQVRLIATKLRRSLTVLGVLSLFVGVIFILGLSRWPEEYIERLSRHVVTLVMITSLYMASAVWRGEGPSRRAYHWALPVSRVRHAWLRIGAGLLWLIAILLIGAIVPAVTGNLSLASLPAWAICVTIVYLLTVIPSVLSDHPDRWFWALLVGYIVGGVVIALRMGRGRLFDAWSAVVDGRLGLAAALSPGDLSAWAPAAALWLAIGVFGVGWAARHYRE